MINIRFIAGFNTMLTLSAALSGSAREAQLPGKPNILFILIDDMGYPAVGCFGNKIVSTPNIDRLAGQGMRFTNGYVAPQSTPSRACLLTGQYGAATKMWHVIPYYAFPYARVKEPEFREELPREEFTLAEAMKSAGYQTACIGKWHLSTWGNDGYYTYLYPEKAHYYGFDYVNTRTDPPEYQSYGDKGVDFLTGEAIGFIEKCKEKPFFVYLSHHTIHNPVLAPPDLVEKYRKAGFPENGLNHAAYLASIEHLDNSIGRLLEKIKELKLEDNTVIFFVSDNGGVDSQFDNFPLRYGKGSAYEGGIRVPFIVRWPGLIMPGSISDIPVHIVDVFPTLIEIAGSALPPEKKLDGVSLLPVFGQKSAIAGTIAKRPLFFYQPLYDIQWGATPSAAVIKNGYKLIHFFGDYIDLDNSGAYIPEGRTELYKISEDIGEKNNISASNPEKTESLKKELFDWIVAQGAEIPSLNPSFDITRWNERSNKK